MQRASTAGRQRYPIKNAYYSAPGLIRGHKRPRGDNCRLKRYSNTRSNCSTEPRDHAYSRPQGLHVGLGLLRLEMWDFHHAEEHEAIERLDCYAIAQSGFRFEIMDVGLSPFGDDARSRP